MRPMVLNTNLESTLQRKVDNGSFCGSNVSVHSVTIHSRRARENPQDLGEEMMPREIGEPVPFYVKVFLFVLFGTLIGPTIGTFFWFGPGNAFFFILFLAGIFSFFRYAAERGVENDQQNRIH